MCQLLNFFGVYDDWVNIFLQADFDKLIKNSYSFAQERFINFLFGYLLYNFTNIAAKK